MKDDPLAGWPHLESPFHAGEQAVQARVGVQERLQQIGHRLIRGTMPDEHRELLERLPFVVLAALDRERRPWASILVGEPGFARAVDAQTVRIAALPVLLDPIAAALRVGTAVGVLAIELGTRRRNRVNGLLSALDGEGLTLAVQQSFGNCPKYIQARQPAYLPAAVAAGEPEKMGRRLSDAAASLVRRADTFFIATATADAGEPGQTANGGADVSHRGGKPGFVRIEERHGTTRLVVPDFLGNFMFNTLGNLAVNPRAGLLFVDFASGDLLQLTGRATVVWDGPELESFDGAERLLELEVEEGIRRPGAIPLRATAVGPSPHLDSTGSWEQVAERVPPGSGR